MSTDQARWPAGTPVAPDGRGPGGGRFRSLLPGILAGPVWHVADSVGAAHIREHGLQLGPGANGAYFGRGIYLSTDQAHARSLLEGYRRYQDEESEQFQVRVTVNHPFIVDATGAGVAAGPGPLMQAALRDAGIAQPGERLSAQEITRRLRAAGYDSVYVHQPGAINHDIGGSQLVVFDPAGVRLDSPDWAQQIDQRLSGALTPDEQDLAAELEANGAAVHPDGTVTVYHHTTPESARMIRETGRIRGYEDGVFFTTKNDESQAGGRGGDVVELRVPLSTVQLDDVFGDEAHLRWPTRRAGDSIDVSGYIVR